MSKQMTMIVGILVLLLCAVGAWLWLSSTKPDSSEIDTQSAHVIPANAELLSNNTLKNIQSRVINGDIPVQVEANYNHEDIFN